MKLRYKYRFYPGRTQEHNLNKTFGCCRYVFNHFLADSKNRDKKLSFNQWSKELTNLKRGEEIEWLREPSSTALQQSLRDLDIAFKNFFDSCKGKRKGARVGYPRFKKRDGTQSFNLTRNGFSIKDNGTVMLSKIGVVKPIWSRELPLDPSSVRVIKTTTNKFFLSFVVEVTPPKHQAINNSVGIDLGIIDFATLSNGEKVKSPNPLKKRLRKLRKLNEALSRCKTGSNRRLRAKQRLANLHEKIANIRTDFLHKLSTNIIKENQLVVLEDLNVSGMVKNRKLSRAISDLGWRTFRVMLEAKASMYDREFFVISRWEPTSQVCSACGSNNGKKKLDVRDWVCLDCGTHHDRDINAAKNILHSGHRALGH